VSRCCAVAVVDVVDVVDVVCPSFLTLEMTEEQPKCGNGFPAQSVKI
jgi:hypothetical protein